MTRPPRPIEWLLQRLLDDASREAVIGDLHEQFVSTARDRGATAATWWYAVEAARSLLSCRITGRRREPGRRYDFEASSGLSLRDLLRQAFRQFRDQPLYALASSGTLALAVGAACVSLAIVKQALIDPLPYRDGARLISLLTRVDGATSAVSAHVFEELRASGGPLTELAAIRPTGAAYATADGTESVSISFVDAQYFSLLGVTPALGRMWSAQEPDAVLVSDQFWRERLSANAAAVGSSISVDGRLRRVVGVLPADFVPPYFTTTRLWAPIDMPTLLADIRTRRTLTVLGARAPGASAADVDAFLALFSQQLVQRLPAMHGGQAWVAIPLRDELVGTARPALIATAAGAVLLLLIVAANIAGLSTARAVAGRHQLAVRAALGATRMRLFVEQLVDSVVLAAVGSLAGVWVGYGLTQLVGRYQEFFLARLSPIALDATSASFGQLCGLVVGLAAALLPSSAIGAAPAEALRAARGGTGDVRVGAARGALVVAQMAIAVVLIVGAGLLLRTVQHLAHRDLGFASERLTWLQVNLVGPRYQSQASQIQFERDVLDRVGQIHGVEAATASVGFPLWGGMMAGLAHYEDAPGTPRREVAYLSVSPNFVHDIGARIVAGRDLLPTDDEGAPPVVVVNETMAKMFWPRGDAVGARVRIGPGSPNERWITVVGIMADMRAHGVIEEIRPTSFGSTRQYSWPRRHIAVRSSGETGAVSVAAELRAAIHAVDPSLALGMVTTSEVALANSLARHRLMLLALGVFGSVALVLCVSGLYAVVVLSSQQRRREYAIRIALGARRGGVRWMVVRQALMLTGAGALAGLATAALGTRVLQGLLHGVEPLDAATFATSALALVALATLAAWRPARVAERVDPMETLRAE